MTPTSHRQTSAFFADFDATTVPCPVGWRTSRMFPDVPVSIILGDEATYVTINYLAAHPGTRATGAGTEAMRRILDLADKHGLTIFLDSVPLDEGWSWERLRKWYMSFGFVYGVEDRLMMRLPHAKGTRRPNPRRRNPDASRALSDAEIQRHAEHARLLAEMWGVEAGWANGEQDLRTAEAFLAWVRTAPSTIRVYRALRLRDPSYLHTEGIGTYWAWKRSGANVYQDDTSSMREALRAGEGNVYLVVGEVDTQHVDWGRTVFKNLYAAPWEHEIEIVEGSPIRLVGMFRTDELGYPSTERWRDSTVNHLHTPVMARANPRKRSRR